MQNPHGLRLEATVAIARHRHFDRADVGQHPLSGAVVAVVARAPPGRVTLLVAKVLGQFGIQRPV